VSTLLRREVPLPPYLVFSEHKIRGLREKTLHVQGSHERSLFSFLGPAKALPSSTGTSDFKSDPIKLFPSIVLVINMLIVTSIVTLKVSSLYNIGHNKCKELFPTKIQFEMDKNPMWPRIIDVVSNMEQGLLARLISTTSISIPLLQPCLI
jgi:hypothetical protein